MHQQQAIIVIVTSWHKVEAKCSNIKQLSEPYLKYGTSRKACRINKVAVHVQCMKSTFNPSMYDRVLYLYVWE